MKARTVILLLSCFFAGMGTTALIRAYLEDRQSVQEQSGPLTCLMEDNGIKYHWRASADGVCYMRDLTEGITGPCKALGNICHIEDIPK